ncbi:hypothetical protein Halru_0748 [Halovivax ruber XH-70]|uniref:Uncharacterized protein n=1 Tax=Halovivax ruber (strain DSM 18193 / JCM 13892 / XH-70) TaxID=797302 RepID=L0I748_HALRX|nr:hypothetical protein [Halovivax ruber]AGB15375.1 hypothetical protein Halru_0748 [Halovivax ruber XH-70]
MPESISVYVNRSGHGTIDVGQSTLSTDRAFELSVENHGDPVHLYVSPGSTLADTLTVQRPNTYVDADETVTVPISVHGHDGPLSGTLSLETRFGANSTAIDVTLTGGVGDDRRVDVDERLATPATDDRSTDHPLDRIGDAIGPETIALGGLATLALLVGLATAAVVEGPFAILGIVMVCSGIAVGVALLVRDTSPPDDPRS